MTLATAALLEADMGTALPGPIRQSLIDITMACNATVLALNAAEIELWRAQSARVALDSRPARFPWQEQAADDWISSAHLYRDRLAIALARCATPFAVYASRVALDVLAGRTPTLPDDTSASPSQLIAAIELLPAVTFPETRESLQDQNAEIRAARDALLIAIDDTVRAGNARRFDALEPTDQVRDSGVGELTLFPDAVLTYAATVTWALGVHTGSR